MSSASTASVQTGNRTQSETTETSQSYRHPQIAIRSRCLSKERTETRVPAKLVMASLILDAHAPLPAEAKTFWIRSSDPENRIGDNLK
jgi:hypothetical protein